MANTIYLVIPCYNEEAVLRETTERLKEKLGVLLSEKKISPDSRVIYVDDGSRDKTWPLIEEIHTENKLFGGIKLSRNRGHQNALLAGLMTVKDKADAVISMDADLQDDINAIDGFIDKFNEGCDIVYGVR
ncbi:MAG: glycosyltransferase, partial [Ruminococcaceae bacterium]|nr:glycosyltransferase [Oscillospiraceae bacterium]